ncbi:helix-turn-helix domain-containing protein [Dyella tabacisoli]|uniref:XRE family transcriptional regulator n=1 Tax=Dyella tabacisoli TaxID=2282381 RepID=A0A369UNP2_9GAMM|nr:helix-turn-helix transcriptional regulator [Dyella tabacisoli]RDD82266.1 XRE family transcriptional regulator [Dyella tabacisoli]
MNSDIDRHEHLARLLRDIRTHAELTQTEVAAALGKPQSYVSKYESGERRLDLVELAELCSVLRISLSELVNEFERKSR